MSEHDFFGNVSTGIPDYSTWFDDSYGAAYGGEAQAAAGESVPGGGGGGWFGDFAEGFGQLAGGIGEILPSAFLFTPAGQSASREQTRAARRARRRARRAESAAAAAARAQAASGITPQDVGLGIPLTGLGILSGLALLGVGVFFISKLAKGDRRQRYGRGN